MLDCSFFYEELKRKGIGFFAGVPDSLLKNFCAYVTDHADSGSHIIAANEGNAVGLAMGHYLAKGTAGLVYMQNSGQGNVVNPLTSLADPEVYGIPMLLLVGWRGEPGIKDEPQHVKQGRITEELFQALEIPCAVLPDSEEAAASVLAQQMALANSEKRPVALLVKKDTFSSYTLKAEVENSYDLSREEAIDLVVQKLDERAVVISTTGKASRELYELRDAHEAGHARDFLTVGGMGHASQIAAGIALGQPDRTVCCLDGDGAALMHLGGMGILPSLNAGNLKHILLNNGVHDSVGGQPTVGFDVDFCKVAEALGYAETYRASSRQELDEVLPRFLEDSRLSFLELRVSAGARDDLGRPKSTPEKNKDDFMEFLRD